METIRRNRPIPATIGAIFGGLWGVVGAQALPHAGRTLWVTAVWVVTLLLIGALWRRGTVASGGSGNGNGVFRQKAYLVAVAAEIAAIISASAILPRMGLESYFVETVGVIVGLHFIGLWQASRQTVFLQIAAGMVIVSGAAMLLPAVHGATHLREAVVGWGNAVVLWIGAGRSIGSAPKQ